MTGRQGSGAVVGERRPTRAKSPTEGPRTERTALRVPDLSGCDALGVALAMAGSGFRVFPLSKASKRPVTIMDGEVFHWSERSTTDLTVVSGWFRDGHHEVGWDLYRSGVFVYDVDEPELLDEAQRQRFREHPTAFQSTRSNRRGKGHVVYGLPWDPEHDRLLRIGSPKIRNAAGQVCGEHKGYNSYVSLGPDHAKASDGGRYRFLSRDIAALPDSLHALVPVWNGVAEPTGCGQAVTVPWSMAGQPDGWLDCVLEYQLPTKNSHAGFVAVTMELLRAARDGDPGGDIAIEAVRQRYLQMPSSRGPAALVADFKKLRASCTARVIQELEKEPRK